MLKTSGDSFIRFSGTLSIPSKHKDVVATLVDNFVATLRNDVLATLCQPTAKVVTALQSHNFPNYLKTSFQHCIVFASANILEFRGKPPIENRH